MAKLVFSQAITTSIPYPYTIIVGKQSVYESLKDVVPCLYYKSDVDLNQWDVKGTAIICRQGLPAFSSSKVSQHLVSKGIVTHIASTLLDDIEASSPLEAIDSFLAALNVVQVKQQSIKKLFDIEKAKVIGFLDKKPPDPIFLVKGLIRMDVTGFLEGAGGTSKSMAFMQLQVSIATGRKWLGLFEIESNSIGSSVGIYGEETREELAYRLYYICQYLKLTPKEQEKVQRRVFMYSAVDDEYLPVLSKQGNNQAEPTDFADNFLAAVEEIKDLKFVAIDPLAKYFGGSMMDTQDAYKYTGQLKKIVRAKGCPAFTLNHINKQGLKEGGSLEGAGYGSVGFRDSNRCMLNLTTMTVVQAAKYTNVDPERHKYYVKMSSTKTNYTAPEIGEWWFERKDYGVLDFVNIDKFEKNKDSEFNWMFVWEYVDGSYKGGKKLNITEVRNAAACGNIKAEHGKKMTKTMVDNAINHLVAHQYLKVEKVKDKSGKKDIDVYIPIKNFSNKPDDDEIEVLAGQL